MGQNLQDSSREDGRLLTIRQAANKYDLTPQTIYQAFKSKHSTLRPVIVTNEKGRDEKRVEESALDAWAQDRPRLKRLGRPGKRASEAAY